MKNKENKNTRTDLLRVLIVCSSVLGIAGFAFHNTTFFLVFSIACACLVVGLTAVALATTPKSIMPIYLIYGIIFLLLLVIGILLAEKTWKGILLGFCFIGFIIAFLSRLIDWIHEYILRSGPEWFDPNYDPYEDEEGEHTHQKPILLDEAESQEVRIRTMSLAFARMIEIVANLSDDYEDFRDNRETLTALARYMDSGLWKEDFEAVENGKLNPEEVDPAGVLSEDGLYNLLEDTKEILDEIKSLDYKS